jgi:hypothetical protein
MAGVATMIAEITNSYSLALDYLRRLVADVPEEMWARQAGGVVNHPAWVVGHLVYSAQAIGGEMGLAPWLAADWADRFGTGSVPLPERERYPSSADLLAARAEAQRRVLGRLAELGEAALAAPLPDARHRATFPTLGHAVLHILTVHAAVHVGQVTAWRRAVGLGALEGEFA